MTWPGLPPWLRSSTAGRPAVGGSRQEQATARRRRPEDTGLTGTTPDDPSLGTPDSNRRLVRNQQTPFVKVVVFYC